MLDLAALRTAIMETLVSKGGRGATPISHVPLVIHISPLETFIRPYYGLVEPVQERMTIYGYPVVLDYAVEPGAFTIT